MGQVPHYLLIGNGRVAKHFQHYFSLRQLSFVTWRRQESLVTLQQYLQQATHVLLLINDQAIDEFIKQYLNEAKAVYIHFSGSLVTPLAYGMHPLMTFGSQLYGLEQYQSIPFILDDDAPTFEELLPGLLNQHVRLAKSVKSKYHALCVLSGNFSCMLWQKLFTTLEQEFKLPSSIAHPYLQQQMQNLIDNSRLALTGPLVRGDYKTIEKNLSALESDPFQDVYKSFVTCFQRLQEEYSA